MTKSISHSAPTPSIREALKPCPFCNSPAESDSQQLYRNITTGNPETAAAIYCTSCDAHMTWCYRDTPEIEREQVMELLVERWNSRAPSVPPQDVVEGVARIVTSEMEQMHKDGVPMCMREGETTWRTYHAGFDLSMFAQRITTAILASELVTVTHPDEAAVRAGGTK